MLIEENAGIADELMPRISRHLCRRLGLQFGKYRSVERCYLTKLNCDCLAFGLVNLKFERLNEKRYARPGGLLLRDTNLRLASLRSGFCWSQWSQRISGC